MATDSAGVTRLPDKWHSSEGVPDARHSIVHDLLVVRLPCEFRTLEDRVSLEKGGHKIGGSDWALIRKEDFAIVSSSSIYDIRGEILWYISNGETVAGGFVRGEEKESNFWPLIAAAAAGYAAHGVIEDGSSVTTHEKRVLSGVGKPRARLGLRS